MDEHDLEDLTESEIADLADLGVIESVVLLLGWTPLLYLADSLLLDKAPYMLKVVVFLLAAAPMLIMAHYLRLWRAERAPETIGHPEAHWLVNVPFFLLFLGLGLYVLPALGLELFDRDLERLYYFLAALILAEPLTDILASRYPALRSEGPSEDWQATHETA